MMDEPSIETLAQVFKCIICMGKLKDAHLCPYCSKACCYTCIHRWLTEQRSHCPHCRVTLRVYELVNCRWVEAVTQQLDTLQQVEDNAKKELCENHNEKLSVFCMSCNKCICHQCALWDITHINHIFRPLEELCLEHVIKIEKEIISLRKRLSELKGFLNGMEQSCTDLRSAKNERVEEIKHSAKQMVSHLEEQLKKQQSTLVEQASLWSEECREIESILKSAEQQLKSCSKSEIILMSENIMQSITEFKYRPINNIENLYGAIDTKFPNEIIPPYDGDTYVISNFSICQMSAAPIHSPPLQVLGQKWRLKVYPAGTKNERGKYLSVFFELCSGSTGISKYQYRVEMAHKKSGDPSKAIVQEFASQFDVGDCWGFNRFYPLNLLVSEGFVSAEEDTLVLDFLIRPLSYHQKSKDQEFYIRLLESTQKSHFEQINNLKESLKNQSVW